MARSERVVQRRRVWRRDGNRCHYCREQPHHKMRTVDHVVPQSHGGPWSDWNLVAACSPCNNRLGNALRKCSCEFCVSAMRQAGVGGSIKGWAWKVSSASWEPVT